MLIAFAGPFLGKRLAERLHHRAVPTARWRRGNPWWRQPWPRRVWPGSSHGGWLLLLLSIIATVLSVTVGAVAGVVAAYRRGKVDGVIMRSVDILLALPQLVLVLLFLSVIGNKLWLLVLAVALAQAPQVSRVVYASAQDICERDFVKVVAMWGMPPRQVILRHVLPSLTTPLAVEAGLRLGFSIILISGLNFLGFGAQPPEPVVGRDGQREPSRSGVQSRGGCWHPPCCWRLLAIGVNMLVDSLATGQLR